MSAPITNPDATEPVVEPRGSRLGWLFDGFWPILMGYLGVSLVFAVTAIAWMSLRWVLIGEAAPLGNAERFIVAAVALVVFLRLRAVVRRRRAPFGSGGPTEEP
jgi:hypothetical protein